MIRIIRLNAAEIARRNRVGRGILRHLSSTPCPSSFLPPRWRSKSAHGRRPSITSTAASRSECVAAMTLCSGVHRPWLRYRSFRDSDACHTEGRDGERGCRTGRVAVRDAAEEAQTVITSNGCNFREANRLDCRGGARSLKRIDPIRVAERLRRAPFPEPREGARSHRSPRGLGRSASRPPLRGTQGRFLRRCPALTIHRTGAGVHQRRGLRCPWFDGQGCEHRRPPLDHGMRSLRRWCSK
ncbi:hypothetical protein MLGJGCBP_05032 [Rhodococcus sp. T7]|nr:hypothetical protein MLGJGCBP_05032 [Rhodococcus sp. T7]